MHLVTVETGEAVTILSGIFLVLGAGIFDRLLTQKNFFEQFLEINLGEVVAWAAAQLTRISILEPQLNIRY
jgi:hypothetical protein